MEPLPYFLLLLKKNVLLCNIIACHTLATTDLHDIKHVSHSEQCVDLLDFSLSEDEKFSAVNIMTLEEDILLTFHTDSSKYFEHPEYYFGRLGKTRESTPFKVFGLTNVSQSKDLGDYVFMSPPLPYATVHVTKATLYGYIIGVTFYGFNKQPAK